MPILEQPIRPDGGSYDHPRLVLIFFALFALLKLALALGYGVFSIDTDYEEFADLLLNGPYHWLTDAELDSPRWWNPHNFRIIGYPMVIATFKWIAGAHWGITLITAQTALGILIAYVLFRFLQRFTGSTLWALFGVLCFESSEILITDTFVKPGSLYARLLTLATIILITGVMERRSASWVKFLGLGLLFAVTFLLREFTLLLLFLYLPFVVLWVWRVRRSAWAVVAACLLVSVPTWTLTAGYMLWNEQRSGHTFVTIANRYVFLIPLANLAQRGVPVFTQNGPIDKVMNEVMREYPIPVRPIRDRKIAEWRTIDAASERMSQQYQMNNYHVYKEVSSRFVKTMIAHPLDALAYAASIDPRALLLFWNPIKPSMPWEFHSVSNHPAGLGRVFTQVQSLGWLGEALVVVPQAIPKPFTVIMSVAFFIVFPWRFLSRWQKKGRELEDRWLVLGLSWVLFVGVMGFYALIVVETRYFAFTLPFAVLVAIAMLQDGAGWLADIRNVTKAKERD